MDLDFGFTTSSIEAKPIRNRIKLVYICSDNHFLFDIAGLGENFNGKQVYMLIIGFLD
jgi:hypothetical protein